MIFHFTGVVAMDERRAIGLRGSLPWHIPADLRHFKQITMSHPILMGRKTFESLGRPLPGRQNIVLSRNADYRPEGICIIRDLSELEQIKLQNPEIMVIGGAKIYKLLLPLMSKLHVSRVPGFHEADTFFPPFEHLFPAHSSPLPMDGFSAITYTR